MPVFVWAEAEAASKPTTWSSVTYSELNCSVQATSNNLLSTLQRRDAVLVLCSPGLQLAKILFACQRAGLIAVPMIPPPLSEFSSSERSPAYHHLLRAIVQANPRAAVANHGYISKLSGLVSHKLVLNLRWLSVEDLNKEVCMDQNHDRHDHYSGCRADEPYLIQYTSGATGIPKPVIVTAGAAAHNARAARKAYDLQPNSMIVSWLPQYHDCGLMFLLLTIVSGATCALTSPSAFLARPRLWLELISEFKATCTPVPSFALPLAVKRGGIDKGKLPLKLESLRNLILINEPIYKSSVKEFVDEFKSVGLNPSSISPSYGLAENCTFVSTAWQCTTTTTPSNNFPSYKKLLPSARLAASPASDKEDIQIMVVDEETCEPVEDGVEVEIWVSSASNASGYIEHPCLTRQVFHGRLKGRTGPCFVRTGDIGVIRGQERYLYVVGRVSDVIKIDGQRNSVHPHYLETAAYDSDPIHLRGGCIAVFQAEKTVVVVAELQNRGGGGGVTNYREICERIRESAMKGGGVGIGMVVLVKSGSVPKTMSGKLRRFLAKDKLLKGKFPVICKVGFEELPISEKGEAGGTDAGKAAEGEALSFAGGDGRHPSLLSFL